MSEKSNSNQSATAGADPDAGAPRTAIQLSPGGPPIVAGQGKQPQRHADEARRRAETHRALTVEIKSRAPAMGVDVGPIQAPLETSSEPGPNANPRPGEEQVAEVAVTPPSTVSALPVGESGRDRLRGPGDRAKEYRARALRDVDFANRYDGWTKGYMSKVAKRRSRLRKLREKSLESQILADGSELRAQLIEAHRELGYTIPKLGELLAVAARHKIDFDTMIALIRSTSNERLRALGYTPRNLIEILLDMARFDVDFESMFALLRSLKKS